jgi:hypothetical protein
MRDAELPPPPLTLQMATAMFAETLEHFHHCTQVIPKSHSHTVCSNCEKPMDTNHQIFYYHKIPYTHTHKITNNCKYSQFCEAKYKYLGQNSSQWQQQNKIKTQ